MLTQAREVYFPSSIPDVISFLEQHAGRATIVAGGTGILSGKHETCGHILVDISRLGLSYFKKDTSWHHIGATVTLQEIVESKELESLANGILCHAARLCNSWLQRNAGTVGGTVVAGFPWNELSTALLSLKARVSLRGRENTEWDFGSYTKEKPSGLILEFSIPNTPGLMGAYARLARTHVDIPVASVAATVLPGGRGWTISCGGIEDDPVLVSEAGAILEGKRTDGSLVDQAISLVCGSLEFRDDFRGNAWYKKEIVSELTRQVLFDLWEKLGG